MITKSLGQIAVEKFNEFPPSDYSWEEMPPLGKKIWEDIALVVGISAIASDPVRKQLESALSELFATFQGLVEKSGHIPEDFPISFRTTRAALDAYRKAGNE